MPEPRPETLAAHAQHIEERPDRDDLPDRYPKGRHCPEEGCITTLCQWNPGPWCYIHAQRHSDELAEPLSIEAEVIALSQSKVEDTEELAELMAAA